MLESTVLNTDYDLAEMSDLQRPNLLDNADFKSGIINQRGQPEYNNIVPNDERHRHIGVDRWSYYCDATETINDGFVRLQLNAPYEFLILEQVVDYKPLKPYLDSGVPLTLTMNCRASIPIKYTLYSTDRYYEIGTEFQDLSITFYKNEIDTHSLDEENGKLTIYVGGKDYNNPEIDYIPSGTYIDIQYVKLELGQHFTGMPVWDESLELVKCLRYQKIFQINASFYDDGNVGHQETYPFEIEMNGVPMVEVLSQGKRLNITKVNYIADRTRLILEIFTSAFGHTTLYDTKVCVYI